jgi:phosphatidylserine/phosphatidylglycerophosphate/cardiolipin synthase-like enzyme
MTEPAGVSAPSTVPIVNPGKNCWRMAEASQAAVVIDAARYYRHIGWAFEQARSSIFIAGWDFDTRIALNPGPKGRGEPLGAFFLRLIRRKRPLVIRILKWNVGALKQFTKVGAVYWLFRWWRAERIDFRFDGAHPVGCSHHQKIVVIDSSLAACGGIDITAGRWDTPKHEDDDGRRRGPDGKKSMPWHDTTMLMTGEVVGALHELVYERWKVATDEPLPPGASREPVWPPGLQATFTDVKVAVARTRAAYKDLPEIREIEALSIDIVAAARRFIYLENQYFTSGKIAAAIAARLTEPDPPEIVLIMPRTADGWLEQRAMDGARAKLVAAIGRQDHAKRFRVFVPVTQGGADIYVHAKVSIVDDRLIRVGSSNLNNRSLGLDSECDIVVDAAVPGNGHCLAAIEEVRCQLLAEHLGCTAERYAAAERKHGSMTGAIESLTGTGKTLQPLDLEQLGTADEFIADNEILDPESVEQMFDPIAKRGLARSWQQGRALLGRAAFGRKSSTPPNAAAPRRRR